MPSFPCQLASRALSRWTSCEEGRRSKFKSGAFRRGVDERLGVCHSSCVSVGSGGPLQAHDIDGLANLTLPSRPLRFLPPSFRRQLALWLTQDDPPSEPEDVSGSFEGVPAASTLRRHRRHTIASMPALGRRGGRSGSVGSRAGLSRGPVAAAVTPAAVAPLSAARRALRRLSTLAPGRGVPGGPRRTVAAAAPPAVAPARRRSFAAGIGTHGEAARLNVAPGHALAVARAAQARDAAEAVAQGGDVALLWSGSEPPEGINNGGRVTGIAGGSITGSEVGTDEGEDAEDSEGGGGGAALLRWLEAAGRDLRVSYEVSSVYRDAADGVCTARVRDRATGHHFVVLKARMPDPGPRWGLSFLEYTSRLLSFRRHPGADPRRGNSRKIDSCSGCTLCRLFSANVALRRFQ